MDRFFSSLCIFFFSLSLHCQSDLKFFSMWFFILHFWYLMLKLMPATICALRTKLIKTDIYKWQWLLWCHFFFSIENWDFKANFQEEKNIYFTKSRPSRSSSCDYQLKLNCAHRWKMNQPNILTINWSRSVLLLFSHSRHTHKNTNVCVCENFIFNFIHVIILLWLKVSVFVIESIVGCHRFFTRTFFFSFSIQKKKKEKCKYEWKIERKWMEKGHSISGKCVERSGMAKNPTEMNERFKQSSEWGIFFFLLEPKLFFFLLFDFMIGFFYSGLFHSTACVIAAVSLLLFLVWMQKQKRRKRGKKKHLKNHQVMLVALTAVDFLILFSFSFFALLFNAFHQFQKVWFCVYFALSFGSSFLFALSIANVHIEHRLGICLPFSIKCELDKQQQQQKRSTTSTWARNGNNFLSLALFTRE